jgi:FKBP-type peptidyl-prolyl cis-trans isomerase FklB
MKIETMKTITLAVTFYLGVGCLAGCASSSKPVEKTVVTTAPTPIGKTPTGTNVLSNEKARTSYAIGMKFGHDFQMQGIEVDTDILVRGLKDIQSGGTTLLTPQEMSETLTEYQRSLAAKQQNMRQGAAAKSKEAAAKNKADGEAFLAKNKTQPGIVTLPDGLQYKVITNGNGTIPKSTDEVTVHYRGTFIDGTEFDNSRKRGIAVHFTAGNVIPGWTEALTQMKVGSKWQLFLPPELAYGEQGRPGIPPNSVLIFEVELIGTIDRVPKPIGLDQLNPPLTSDIIKVPSLEEMKNGAKIEVIKPEEAAKFQPVKTRPSQTNQLVK